MGIRWDIQTHESLPSTQNLCKDQAALGAAEGLVIRALEQTDGHGRRGREWVSGQGNLTLSLLLRPECKAMDVGQLSILIGVALLEVAQEMGAGPLLLKWPNDLLCDGRKCAGILLDSGLSGDAIDWLVIGIGVNTQDAPEGAACLELASDAFLDALLEKIGLSYAMWKIGGFEDIRRKWVENSYPKGTMLNVGVFEGLDAYGNLVVLDDTNALKTISAGDVYLKDADYATGH